MDNTSFPWWSGPFVGAGVGSVIGFWLVFRKEPLELSPAICIGGAAAIGAVAGLLLMIVEFTRRNPKSPDEDNSEQ